MDRVDQTYPKLLDDDDDYDYADDEVSLYSLQVVHSLCILAVCVDSKCALRERVQCKKADVTMQFNGCTFAIQSIPFVLETSNKPG